MNVNIGLALVDPRSEHQFVAPSQQARGRDKVLLRLVHGGTMGSSAGQNGRANSARCVALVGPYLAGKTTLLEAILARTGTIKRQGTVVDKSTIGDSSVEARDHGMRDRKSVV